MKSFKVKEFKAYQSVKFGKHQVTHFHQNKNNAMKSYLRDITMDFIPELNSIFVRGDAGKTCVNMSNVSDWVPASIDDLEANLDGNQSMDKKSSSGSKPSSRSKTSSSSKSMNVSAE